MRMVGSTIRKVPTAAAPARAMLPFSAREVSTRGRVLRDSSVMNTRGEK